ncbi:hypothetical protein HN51_032418 [Arachis hypogaea]
MNRNNNSSGFVVGGGNGGDGEWVRVKECVTEFMKGVAKMTVELGKDCRDIVKQSLVNEESYLVKNFGRDSYLGKRVGRTCSKVCEKLNFFNEYLCEDKEKELVAR